MMAAEEAQAALPREKVRRFGVSADNARAAAELEAKQWVPPVYEKSLEEQKQLAEIIRTSRDSKLQMMFGSVQKHTFQQIIDAMSWKKVEEGESVIKEGDEGDFFYIVKSGHFDIFQTRAVVGADAGKRPVKVLEAGAGFAFGELALLYNAPRSATVIATVPSELWCLERMAFRRLVVSSSQEQFNQHVEFLSRCDIFAELTSDQIASLAEVVQEEDFDEDEAILEQGDRDNKMYILRRGEAIACIKGEKGEAEVKKYSQGDYFGEIALLLGEPRKASVYAVGPCTCMYISRDTFNGILGPLRDFLQRNMDKYQKYQEALAAGSTAMERRCSGGLGDLGVEDEACPGVLASQSSEDFSPTKTEVFDGGGQRFTTKGPLRKRDRAVQEAPEVQQPEDSEPASLKEKIEVDFQNSALVSATDTFTVHSSEVQVFGGLRLGENFTTDKKVIARSKTASVSDGTEDMYTWHTTSWLKGATHVAVLCQKGQKSASDPTPNQDNYFTLYVGPTQLYGVCDGHGPFGHLVSFRLVQTLPYFLAGSPHFGKDWEEALKGAFRSAQSDLLSFCEVHKINVQASGAAASVLVFEGPQVHIAHIGDAGVMVASWNKRDSHLVAGTKDHKPELPEERARLEAAGSEVREVAEGSYRIYIKGTSFPGLTMSRAFGDVACAGLLQEPDYQQLLLQPSDEYYAIIASDGVWEFIDYEKAVELTSKKLRLKGPRETARFLVEASRKRWAAYCGDYCDDITAVVVQWNVSEKETDDNHCIVVQRPKDQ